MQKQSIGLLLLRVLVGWVFLSEGIQKLLFPGTLGVARFAKIGIPLPSFSAPFVGVVEAVFGTLVLLGLYTALSTIPLLAVISTAIVTTKIPFLIHHGFWAALHESRTDFSMLFGLIAILCLGPGLLSLDTKRGRHPSAKGPRIT
jgi:putative oxidoreductase